MPGYKIEDFLSACRKHGVILIYNVSGDAYNHFGLNKVDLLDFIGNGGLQNLEFISTKLWDKNPKPENMIYVDSYEFITGTKYGYIAFMNNGSKWIIKSFKPNTNYGGNEMQNALLKAGIKKLTGENNGRKS